MTIKNVSFKDLSKNVEDNNSKIKLIIIPYGIVPEEDRDVYYPFLHHKNSGFLVPFDCTIDKKTILKIEIADKIREETMSVLEFDPDALEENSNLIVNFEIDEESEKEIYTWAVVFIFTGLVGIGEINEKIMDYVDAFKLNIRLYPFLNGFTSNLVYISAEDLYDLSKGFFIVNDEGENYEVDVSEGMDLSQDIVSIYRLKRGDVPFTEIQTEEPNAPFQKRKYYHILNGEILVSILDDESVNSFYKDDLIEEEWDYRRAEER